MPESTIPRTALRLGLAGLVPSAAVPAAMLAWPEGRDLLAVPGLAPGWWLALRRPLSLALAGLHAATALLALSPGG